MKQVKKSIHLFIITCGRLDNKANTSFSKYTMYAYLKLCLFYISNFIDAVGKVKTDKMPKGRLPGLGAVCSPI